MTIKNWLPEERPREKIRLKGGGALSNAELLAIFIRRGRPGKTAIDLGRELLAHWGSLGRLMDAIQQEKVLGLGQVAHASLLAAIELINRYLQEAIMSRSYADGPDKVKAFLRLKLGNLTKENFACLLLNKAHHIIHFQILFEGTIDEAPFYPREILALCFDYHATALIIVHNHPSGQGVASATDIQATERLYHALQPFGVNLLDHFLVVKSETFSFIEQGWWGGSRG